MILHSEIGQVIERIKSEHHNQGTLIFLSLPECKSCEFMHSALSYYKKVRDVVVMKVVMDFSAPAHLSYLEAYPAREFPHLSLHVAGAVRKRWAGWYSEPYDLAYARFEAGVTAALETVDA